MIFTKLIKPKWQSTDPETRKTALKETDDPSIINEMAQHDESSTVRRAAIYKINDLDLLDTIVQQDADSGVREVALQRFKQLLAGQKENTTLLAARLEWVDRITSAELLEYVAKHGQEFEIRLAATQQINNQEILADIAINDPSNKVRLIAVENLTQQAQLEHVFKNTRNRDKTVNRIAHDKLNALIEANERPLKIRQECETLCFRLEKFGRGDRSNKIWEQEQAEYKHVHNRWQAIEQAEIEADLQTRFVTAQQAFTTALEQFQTTTRLQQQAVTERLAQRKIYCQQLTVLLNELDEHQLAQHFPSLEVAADLQQRISSLKNQWNNLGRDSESDEEQQYLTEFEQNSEVVQKRYQQIQANDTALTQLEKINQEIQALLRGREVIKSGHIAHMTEQWQKQPAHSSTIPLFVTLNQQINDSIAALQQKFEAQKQQNEQTTQLLKQQLQEMEIALNDGQLQTAIALEQQVIDKLKHNRQLPVGQRKSLEERLQVCSIKIKELRDWQDWGILLRRKSLCHLVESLLTVEALNASTSSEETDERLKNIDSAEYEAVELSLKNELLLPDLEDLEDVARFVQNAQVAWKDLGAAGYSHQLWERFNTACNHAYQPCQLYFEAKAQERAQNLAKKQKICEKLETFFNETNWDDDSIWKSVNRFTSKMHKDWYAVGVTNKRDKKAVQKRFDSIFEQIDEKVNAEKERNGAERNALIEAAKVAASLDDLDLAIQQAKDLQKQWHVTVPDKRSVEQRSWKEFRQICDSIFERRAQLQVDQEQALQDNFTQRALLCDQVKTLLKFTGEQVKTIPNQLKELQIQWQQMPAIPNRYEQKSKTLEKQFATAIKNVESNYPKQLAILENEQLILLGQKASVCVEMEQQPDQLESIRARWTTMPKLVDEQLETKMQQRFETACAGQTSRDPALVKRKEILCIRMEILAGIESPPEQRNARMEYQVMRLSDAMTGSGEKNLNKQEDIHEIQLEWYLTGVLADHINELEQRFSKARDAFYHTH